ncbi:MAG: hypothetical protein N2504_06970 [candidate division WOR-3 bacterium]|nr:hypothetical protein [candidate division WOR-3 bacterium]MCX7948308.1 hypothetical protein [candidate division WOR-3 bacterium]MDW8151146.1 hypothetical protein [candidate division WOR-3 bacterium]
MTIKSSNKIWIVGDLDCSNTVRVMKLLDFLNINYEWIKEKKKLVVFFEDGSYLINPSDDEIISKLQINQEKLSEFYRRKTCI